MTEKTIMFELLQGFAWVLRCLIFVLLPLVRRSLSPSLQLSQLLTCDLYHNPGFDPSEKLILALGSQFITWVFLKFLYFFTFLNDSKKFVYVKSYMRLYIRIPVVLTKFFKFKELSKLDFEFYFFNFCLCNIFVC